MVKRHRKSLDGDGRALEHSRRDIDRVDVVEFSRHRSGQPGGAAADLESDALLQAEPLPSSAKVLPVLLAESEELLFGPRLRTPDLLAGPARHPEVRVDFTPSFPFNIGISRHDFASIFASHEQRGRRKYRCPCP